MSEHSEDFFYLIDHGGNRRVPIKIAAKDGRYGYAVHPKGKGNDASAADYTTDEKRMVQAVVLQGLGVRCRARGGPHDGQQNTLGLTGRAIRGYWLAPNYRGWVAGAKLASEEHDSKLSVTASTLSPVVQRIAPTAATPVAPHPTAAGSYCNQTAFSFAEHCCQGGTREMGSGAFSLDDLTILEEGNRRLRFSPLGNRPVRPRVALVGITPGGQIERFAANLAAMDVPTAASKAAFGGAQPAIKKLIGAHGLAKRIGIALEGDLNDNPEILTTSIVKCCLMVDDGYRFVAPDIAASAAATHCATNRFVDDLLSYPGLEWVFVFGEPGWKALHDLHREGRPLIEILRSAGLKVLQLPHFAQNFQQRALFTCSPTADADLLKEKPDYARFAAAAHRMREAVLAVL